MQLVQLLHVLVHPEYQVEKNPVPSSPAQVPSSRDTQNVQQSRQTMTFNPVLFMDYF